MIPAALGFSPQIPQPPWFCAYTRAEHTAGVLSLLSFPPGAHLTSRTPVSRCCHKYFFRPILDSRLRATHGPPQTHVNLGMNLGDISCLCLRGKNPLSRKRVAGKVFDLFKRQKGKKKKILGFVENQLLPLRQRTFII